MSFELIKNAPRYMNQKLRNFLRPSLKKWIFFAILALPFIFGLVSHFFNIDLHNPNFYGFNVYRESFLGLWFLLLTFSRLRLFLIVAIIPSLYFATPIVLAWPIAALFEILWNRFFSLFTRRASFIETITTIVIFSMMVWFGFIGPMIARHSLEAEVTFRESIPMTELEECCDGHWVLTVTVRNNSYQAAEYTAPLKTACLYDDETGLIKNVVQGYRRYPDDGLQVQGGIIKAGEEKSFQYILWSLSPVFNLALGPDKAELDNPMYDSILLFGNPQSSLVRDKRLCQSASEEEIRDAYKIKIDPVYENIGQCSRFDNVDHRSGCYRDMAIRYFDIELCEKAEHCTDRNLCYYYIAVKEDNALLCRRIEGWCSNFDPENSCVDLVSPRKVN